MLSKRTCLFLVPLLLITSCVDFTDQTLSYRYDKETDTLRIFQVYEGIFGSEAKDGITSEEEVQLASLYERGRTFFFGNWISEYDEDSMRELTETPLEKAEEEGPPTQQELEAHRAVQALARLLLKQVRIENGAFYRNEKGQLCGYQRVTIHRVGEVIAASNRSIGLGLLISKAENSDPDATARQRKAAKENVAFIQRKGNEFRFHWPSSARAFRKTKAKWAAEFDDAVASEHREPDLIEAMLRQDFWISYLDENMVVSLGFPTNIQTHLSLDLKKEYAGNLEKYVEEQYGIEDQIDIERLRDAFLSGQKSNPEHSENRSK